MWNSFGTVSANQGGFMDTSSPSTNRARKPAGTMSVVPCTVWELLNVAQSSDRFTTRNGIDVSNVMIVGLVRSTTRNADATYVEYTVDDHSCSSTILIRHYQNGGEAGAEDFPGASSFDDPHQTGMNKAMAVGKYIRAFGMVRANPNATDRSKRILVTCYKLREVRDALELVRHRLELIHFRLALKSENNNASRSVTGPSSQFSGNTSAAFGQSYGSAAGPGPTTGGAPQRGGSAVSEVQTFLRSAPPNGSGYSIQTITQALSGRFSEREVRSAIDFLQEEGIAYQTVDENTFSLVDM